jgi:hypothetical protein
MGFFLLPSPFHKNDDPLVIRKLIAAPVMDREKILHHARELEQKSRVILKQRINKINQKFCLLDETKRDAWLKSSMNQMNRDHDYWVNTLQRFDRMVDHWLEDRLETSPLIQRRKNTGESLFSKNGRTFLVESELSRARDSRKAASELIAARQKLIRNVWEEVFEDLEDLSGSTKSDCLSELEAESNYMPGEKLHEPLYLSRYEFLSTLPDGVRMEFILLLNRE